jgi:hypothetical protein
MHECLQLEELLFGLFIFAQDLLKKGQEFVATRNQRPGAQTTHDRRTHQ